MQIERWSNPKRTLLKKLDNAIDAKRNLVKQWKENERILFRDRVGGVGDLFSFGQDSGALDAPEPDNSGAYSDISYVFKNVRFIHSQIATNPPSVNIRPSTSDYKDAQRADIADRVSKYAFRHYRLKEPVDLTSLNCIVYGTGIIGHSWNTNKGDITGFNAEKDSLLLSGDIDVKPVNPWKFFIDPDAVMWRDVNWVFEEILMDWDEAVHKYPDRVDLLKEVRIQGNTPEHRDSPTSSDRSDLEDVTYDSVLLYAYYEKGAPFNGMLGRYALITRQGDLIDGVRDNPHTFTVDARSLKNWPKGKELPQVAKIPYSLMTDIDVPGRVWGKSFVEYAGPQQDYLNEMDSISLENVRAHGMTRAFVPESSDVSEITDSSWQVYKMKGLQTPLFATPPKPMPELINTRSVMRTGIDDMSGVNESMFGQQSREIAGFAMQYATNQGNMIRHRLFIKYSMMIEDLYEHLLLLFAENWSTPRTIKVVGEENRYEVSSIQGADFAGGYDIVVEYGTSLSLDPITRRQEIMQLMPIFEKAGMTADQILEKLRMNDLTNMYDDNRLAKARMQEVFNRIIETEEPQVIKMMQDHTRMLAWAYTYIMTADFERLPDVIQDLIYDQIEARENLVAQRAQAAAGGGVPGAAPGMPSPADVAPPEGGVNPVALDGSAS